MLNIQKFVVSLIDKLPAPVANALKAVAAAVLPLVSVSLLNGSLDYKAIVAAALTALAVYVVPNKADKKAPKPVPAPVSPSAGK